MEISTVNSNQYRLQVDVRYQEPRKDQLENKHQDLCQECLGMISNKF